MPNDVKNPGNPVPIPNSLPTTNPAPANALVNTTASPGGKQVGVFTTTQSLLTFSGSTAAVTTIWSVIGKIYPSVANKMWLPLVISFAMGLIIYIGTVSNTTDWRQKITEAVVALVNTFTIAAAALGIGSVNSPTTTTSNPSSTLPATNSSTNANARSFYKKPLSDGREVSVVYRENEKPKLAVR